jgi:hypothetical protein
MRARAAVGTLAAAVLVVAASCATPPPINFDAGIAEEFCGHGTVACNVDFTCPASSTCTAGACQCFASTTAVTCAGVPCGSSCPSDGYYCAAGGAVGDGGTTRGDGASSSGTCAGGFLVSTLDCDPLGSGGMSSYCLTASEYTGVTGMPLPASCAPTGTTGCEGESGAVAGALVKPCCPGLTCRVGSVCGDPTGALGGSCQP